MKIRYPFVRRKLQKNWEAAVSHNTDPYGLKVIECAQQLMELLHEGKGCEEAWIAAVKNKDVDGVQTVYIATTVYTFSPREPEFRKWFTKHGCGV